MKLTKVFSFVLGSFGIAQAEVSDPKVRAFITDLLGLSSKLGLKLYRRQNFASSSEHTKTLKVR